MMGTRQMEMKTNFNLAIRSLLTPCSKQVVTCLHGAVEDEFESCCRETQVGTALDTVEQQVEELDLDPLFSDNDSCRTNVMDVAHNLSTKKKDVIQNLTKMLEEAEEENQHCCSCVELFKKQSLGVSGISNAVEQLRSGSLGYGM